MNSDPDPDGADIRLDSQEAVVLFELLSRWSETEEPRTPGRECFESTAEGAVLLRVLASLEQQLVAPFKSNYREILAAARQHLAGRWDYPTIGK